MARFAFIPTLRAVDRRRRRRWPRPRPRSYLKAKGNPRWDRGVARPRRSAARTREATPPQRAQVGVSVSGAVKRMLRGAAGSFHFDVMLFMHWSKASLISGEKLELVMAPE